MILSTGILESWQNDTQDHYRVPSERSRMQHLVISMMEWLEHSDIHCRCCMLKAIDIPDN
jgi:hypothetical protein